MRQVNFDVINFIVSSFLIIKKIINNYLLR